MQRPVQARPGAYTRLPGLLVGFLIVACGASPEATTEAVPDTVLLVADGGCGGCRLSLDTIGPTTGGPADPTAITVGAASSLDLGPGGEIWLALADNIDPGRIVRYDSAGVPAEFARPGDGPGEFRQISGLEVEGDSVLWVWGDRYVRRVRRSDGEFLSEERNLIPQGVQAMVRLGGYRFVLVGWSTTPGHVNCANCPETAGDRRHPLGIATFSDDGRLLSHSRVEDLFVVPADNAHAWAWGNLPVAASNSSNGFWTAAPDRIEVTRRDSAGAARRVLTAAAPWFGDWDPGTDFVDVRVVWMDEDDQGRLWLVLDGDRTVLWQQSGLRKVPWGAPPEPEPETPRLRDRITAVVVIDPQEEVILLERVLPVHLLGRNSGPLVVVSEVSPGHQTITPIRLSIEREQ